MDKHVSIQMCNGKIVATVIVLKAVSSKYHLSDDEYKYTPHFPDFYLQYKIMKKISQCLLTLLL